MSDVQSITTTSSPLFVPASLDLRQYVPKDLHAGKTAGIYLMRGVPIGKGKCERIEPGLLALSGTVKVPGYDEQNIVIDIRLTGPNSAVVIALPVIKKAEARVTPVSGKLRFDLTPSPVTPVTMWYTDRNIFEGSRLGFELTYEGVPFSPFYWFD